MKKYPGVPMPLIVMMWTEYTLALINVVAMIGGIIATDSYWWLTNAAVAVLCAAIGARTHQNIKSITALHQEAMRLDALLERTEACDDILS